MKQSLSFVKIPGESMLINVGDYELPYLDENDELHLNKLKNAVNQFGTQRTIDGVTFEKAIKIKVVISGYLEEGGPKKSITRIFWLVNVPRER